MRKPGKRIIQESAETSLISETPHSRATLDNWLKRSNTQKCIEKSSEFTAASEKKNTIIMLSDSEPEEDIFAPSTFHKKAAARERPSLSNRNKNSFLKKTSKKTAAIFDPVITCLQPSEKNQIVLRKSLDLSSLKSGIQSIGIANSNLKFKATSPKGGKSVNANGNETSLLDRRSEVYEADSSQKDYSFLLPKNRTSSITEQLIYSPEFAESNSPSKRNFNSLGPFDTTPSLSSLRLDLNNTIDLGMEAKENDFQNYYGNVETIDTASTIEQQRDPLGIFNSDDECDIGISTATASHTSIPGFMSLQDCADDDPILQQFRDQFSSRKRARKAVQEDDELITVDLSNSDFSKLCPKPTGKKKTGAKPTSKRARNKSGSNAEKDDSSIDGRPTLKAIYRRSFVNGRYDKMVYTQLKKKHGYSKRRLHQANF